MTNQEKTKMIFEAVDEQYSIPSYFEDRVSEAITRALVKIEREETKAK